MWNPSDHNTDVCTIEAAVDDINARTDALHIINQKSKKKTYPLQQFRTSGNIYVQLLLGLREPLNCFKQDEI